MSLPHTGTAWRATREWRTASSGDEEGSVSVELVLLTPLILLVVALLVLAGRLVDLRLQVESAAHQAARAASHQRFAAATGEAANQIIAELGPRCGTPSTTVDTTKWAPGGTVTVTVTCNADLADLTLLPLPAQVPVTASFTSPIDRFATSGQP